MNTPPYFLPSLIKAYREAAPDSEEARKLALKIKANVGDIEALKRILGNADTKDEDHEPEESSFHTIDAFLDKFNPGKMTGAYIPDAAPADDPESSQAEPSAETRISIQQTDNLVTLKQLIKSQQYKKAIEIIEQGNLNNPQKNIYFAHQIRFLKKLMAIHESK